ncbi:MAG: ferritin [Candidatus Abyssobacteria bacterium SURF_5]|uniref:Ferritin n=1 Tax=Abyssobacteria bacterium (strain SURF_5) TaxID=2093360 RepID=A0A3A4NNI5_ABYX5|nr:MAG: ferritin [Candidatus Abyssubacteria bacterium SURF_5]
MAGTYHELYEKLSKATLDLHRAWISLKEEIEAMDWYQQRIDATDNLELKDILKHNRDEEKEHSAMLMEWIRRNDPEFAKQMKTYLFKDGKAITEIEEEAD